jgi:transmembrane sensor
MDHRFERLLRKYKAHEASPEEEKELLELIQSDAYDQALLEDITYTLHNTPPGAVHMKDRIKDETFDKIIEEHVLDKSSHPGFVHRSQKSGWRWLAVAASLVLIALAGLWLFYNKIGFLTGEQHYAGKRTILLPDGSHVTLNADSELTYFTEGLNRIVALRGEAYFDVVHDARRPFIVQTGKIRTRVLGTSFNVRAYLAHEEVQVTVERGLVEVGEESRPYAQIKPDEQITVDTRTARFSKAEVDVHAATAWKDEGSLMFEDITLEEVIVLIEQRYQYTLVFTNPALRTCRMSGSFTRNDDLTKIVSVICGMSGAEYQIDDDKHQVTITGGSCQ